MAAICCKVKGLLFATDRLRFVFLTIIEINSTKVSLWSRDEMLWEDNYLHEWEEVIMEGVELGGEMQNAVF